MTANDANDDDMESYLHRQGELVERDAARGAGIPGPRALAKLRKMAVPDLVDSFVSISLLMDDALFNLAAAKFNRLYFRLEAVEAELKSRDNDQRRALLPLLKHPHEQIRLRAAFATLVLAPQASRDVIKAVAANVHHQIASQAASMLDALETGRYVPT